ncbi:SHOCT domain-containing protein [Halobacteria archaeon HArc-curdl7]|uniref:SHOCT domain-containing protein n=2 Tax=Halapricum hydrolyticum TaxID=2979991 RepID=A0AAE3LFX5_9EURY|nr:SHOCT domain-containing protein [Halapricum hydrolyticum]
MIWSLLLQMGSGTGGWWMVSFLGPLVGLLIMGTVVYLLWSAIAGSTPESTEQTNDAIETLRKRYARGEIDEEEFEERARMLRER